MTIPGGGAGSSAGWVPPVAPWPTLFSQPTCTVTAPVPAAALVGMLAEELRRQRLRVAVAPDGRSLRAKPTWPVVLTAVGMLAGGEGFTTPRITVSVAAESPAGTALTVLGRAGGVSGMSTRVAGALTAVAARLAQGGASFTATPWERYTRFGKG